MEYDEWRDCLFEEIYPQYSLTNGHIKWDDDTSERIIITWNNKQFIVSLEDLYQEHDNDPLDTLVHWVYKSLEVVPLAEKDNIYLSYDFFLNSYSLYVLRPRNSLYVQHNVDPELWKKINPNPDLKKIIDCELSGSLLMVSSKDERLPSTVALAYPELSLPLLHETMDCGDDFHILVPSDSNNMHMFIGHSNSINRLAIDFMDNSAHKFTIHEWKTKGKAHV